MTTHTSSATTNPEPDLAKRVAQLDDQQVLQAWELFTGGQPPRVPVAYVTATLGASLDAVTVRQRLLDLVPSSNVPANLVVLSAIPQDAQGKEDRTALGRAVVTALASDQTGTAPEVETGDTLSMLVRHVWAAYLPGATDAGPIDFFRAGGDSITAIRTVTALNGYLNSSVGLVTLFRFARSDLFTAHLKSGIEVSGLDPAQLQARAFDALNRLDAKSDS